MDHGSVRLGIEKNFLSVPSGGVARLLPNKIQEGEEIGSKERQPSTSGAKDGNGQYLDSDGNRVNLGNFNADGLNLNNNSDDNRNDNLAVASSLQS